MEQSGVQRKWLEIGVSSIADSDLPVKQHVCAFIYGGRQFAAKISESLRSSSVWPIQGNINSRRFMGSLNPVNRRIIGSDS